MLRILSNKLYLLKTFEYPLAYFNSKILDEDSPETNTRKFNKEINLLKNYINKEQVDAKREPILINYRAKKGPDPLPRSRMSFRDKIKGQKKKNLAELMHQNPELLQAIPAARLSVIVPEEEMDFGLDIHPVEPDNKLEHEGKYFDSLGYRRKEVLDKHIHERIRENEMRFVDAYTKPDKPVKSLMTKQEMEAVHLEIDKRMQELEDTGLARHEILNKPRGTFREVPLKDDPVFQLIKENRAVREMLITAHEEFSAENVIRKALEQNIGPDPSIANFYSRYITEDQFPEKDRSK